jgi:hypothetical protein
MDRKRRNEIEQAAADRLLRSADVLLAARERGKSDGVVEAWLGNPDRDEAPASNRPFSYEELVEGMCFLIRCGIVEPTAAGARGQGRAGPNR